jgi:ribonuclease Z
VLRDEALGVFGATVLPRDFDTIEIPFAERGGPELVRWKDRPGSDGGPVGEPASTAELH